MVTGDLDALIAAHVAGAGLTAAARSAGMSRVTAWRRLGEPDVQALIADVRATRRAALLGWAAQVRSLGDLTLDALVALLDDPDLDPGHLLRLAALVLPEVRNLAHLIELDERIAALEAALTPAPTEER